MSIALRRRKLRPLPLSSKTTLSARRAASSAPVVPYRVSTMLTTSVVVAVPLLRKALRSERSSGSISDAGATSCR